MTNYAQAAIRAVKICREHPGSDPVAAWETAVASLVSSNAGRVKSCPRCTFLGLCEEGLVSGISAARYLPQRNNKNARYAVAAVALLRENPSLTHDLKALWRMVMAGESKEVNGQMAIVVALWNAGLITR